MTETKTEKQTKTPKTHVFYMTNGVKVEVDPSKNTGNLLMKCRNASNGSAVVLYIMSEIALFDGEKIPAPELLNKSAFDIIEIEEIWANLKEKK